MEFVKVRSVKSPTRGTSKSAGIDFYIPDDFQTKELSVGDSILIPCGIKMKVEPGHALIFFNKSGVATKLGLQIGACVVDEDYQGEIHIHLTKVSGYDIELSAGMKIVQGVLIPITYSNLVEFETSEDLWKESTERGEGGFGSTDQK